MPEKEAYAPSVHWFETAHGYPNKTEVLFFALLICSSGKSAGELLDWSRMVLLEEKSYVSEDPAAWLLPVNRREQKRGRGEVNVGVVIVAVQMLRAVIYKRTWY